MYKWQIAHSVVQLADIMTYLKGEGHTEIQWAHIPEDLGQRAHFLITYYHDIQNRVKENVPVGACCSCSTIGKNTCDVHY